MARDVETILGLLGITNDNITYDMLITKLKTTNTLTDDELNNIMNISVKPLPTVVRNQPDLLKQKMYGIVTDENLGLTAVLNKRFVLFQSLIEVLKNNIDLNQENVERSLQELEDMFREEIANLLDGVNKQIEDILNGTTSVAHAIDAETAQYAIYDINGNEIIDYYAKLVDLQNHLAAYDKHLQEFAQHVETARWYFEGDVAIPKAIADKYGNDIPSTYATILELQMAFDSLNQHLEEINPYFNGTKAMPKAEKDRNGNTIDLTYATISSLNAVLNDIAAIKTVLTSNDTDLDTLQELVNALKNNVASIGDLFDQLANKVDKSDYVITNESPTSKAVGGISVGTSLKGKTVLEVLEDMLFPYVPFALNVSAITPSTATYEKGTSVTLTKVNVAITMGSKSITSLKLYDSDNTTLLGEKSTDITTNNAFTINKTVTSSVTFYATASDGEKTITDSSSFLNFYDPTFYGSLDTGYTLSSELITAKTKVIKSSKSNTLTYNSSNQHPFIAYPASYGKLTSIKDSSNLEYLGDFVLTTMDFTVKSGTVSYNVYVLKEPTDISNFKFIFS